MPSCPILPDLQAALTAHRRWLRGTGGERLTLIGEDLAGLDLRAWPLDQAWLICCDLSGTALPAVARGLWTPACVRASRHLTDRDLALLDRIEWAYADQLVDQMLDARLFESERLVDDPEPRGISGDGCAVIQRQAELGYRIPGGRGASVSAVSDEAVAIAERLDAFEALGGDKAIIVSHARLRERPEMWVWQPGHHVPEWVRGRAAGYYVPDRREAELLGSRRRVSLLEGDWGAFVPDGIVARALGWRQARRGSTEIPDAWSQSKPGTCRSVYVPIIWSTGPQVPTLQACTAMNALVQRWRAAVIGVADAPVGMAA